MRVHALGHIVGPSGILEARIDLPAEEPRAAVVLCHAHPGSCETMQGKAVYRTSKALAHVGCAVLRFNFRGVGASAGTFDDGIGEQDDFRAAVDWLVDRYPRLPIWAAGVSFGAWVALAAGAHDPRISQLIGIATPVTRFDFSDVTRTTKPITLVHGERDEVASVHEIRKFYAALSEPKELIELDGASHLFEARTMDLGQAVEELFAGG